MESLKPDFFDRLAVMSNITISPAIGPAIGNLADSNANTPSPKTPSSAQPISAPIPSANPADAISLSPGAQSVTVAASSSAQPLTDSAASAQSVSLRQQLGNTPLSGTARQNQAIVALLR
jgi:hypothetical protein